MRRSRTRLLLVTLLVVTALSPSTPAVANWSVASVPGGGGVVQATTVERGSRPAASAAQSAVSVTWAATTLATGRAVTGYQVRRYDSAMTTEATVLGGCAGTVTVTWCTESPVPNGSWVYTITPLFAARWHGAQSDPSATVDVAADLVAPVNHVSVSPQLGGAALVGNTVYYRGVAAGSLLLENRLADYQSGPASSATSPLTGLSTGWSHTPSTVSTPAGGPYVSAPFDWTAGTSSAPAEEITGRDVAGNTTVTTVTFADDSTPPTPGSITYPDGAQTALSVTVSFTDGTDSGAGLASRRLQRGSSTVSGSTCGVFGAFADLGRIDPTSPYADTGLSRGRCYRYRYVVTDRVGNQHVATSTNVVRVVAASDGGPPLGSAATFSVLGLTAVASTAPSGPTTLSGNLGVSPNSDITGFPPGIVAGTIHRADPVAEQAQIDLKIAYDNADNRIATTTFTGDRNGTTFGPGVHHTTDAFALTGTMYLDGRGDPNALFIFQVDAALNTAAASRVVLINEAQASHVYWQSLGAAGTGANSTFAGTILAEGAITLGAGSTLIGRALSRGTVTLASNTVRFTDAPPPLITIDGGPTKVTKSATPTISGTTDATTGTLVRVVVNGQSLTAPTQVGGTWSTATAALPSGTHQVVASVGDEAGNAASASQLLTVELNPLPVNLGSAASFSVLSGAAVANAGSSTISGDVGARDSITGFPPGTTGGGFHLGDALHTAAMGDLRAAYGELRARVADTEFGGDQIGKTFHAGVHHSAAAFLLTGPMTLDAEGIPGAIFIFQIDAAMSPAAGGRVVLVNGAQARNVYWRRLGETAPGATSKLVGAVLSGGGHRARQRRRRDRTGAVARRRLPGHEHHRRGHRFEGSLRLPDHQRPGVDAVGRPHRSLPRWRLTPTDDRTHQ